MSKNVKKVNEAMEQMEQEMRADYTETMEDIIEGMLELEQEEITTGQQILEKEEQMRKMLKTYRMLQKMEKKLIKDMEELSDEYDTLIAQANEIEIEDYKPDFKLKDLFEKAKAILFKRKRDSETDDLKKLVALSYDVSAELNQLRYKARKTPEEITRQQELIRTLEETRIKIGELTSDMHWKDCK